MANDRRYLYRGNADRAVGQVFNIGPTPTAITSASLGSGRSVRLQILAGLNVARADEGDWANATASNGRPLVLSDDHPYILMTQPGLFRLHPADLMVLPPEARVWLEDATYLGADRIIYTSDLRGSVGAASGGANRPGCGPCCGELIDVLVLNYSCEFEHAFDKPELPEGTACVEIILSEMNTGHDMLFVMHEPETPPTTEDMMRARRLCVAGALYLTPGEYERFHLVGCIAPRDANTDDLEPADMSAPEGVEPDTVLQIWAYGT